MAVPHKYLLLGAAAIAVHVIRRRGRRDRSVQQCRGPKEESTPALIHAFTSAAPSDNGISAPSIVPQRPGSPGCLALLFVASGLIIVSACIAALREQWDLAVAALSAWFLALLSQVLQRQCIISSSNNGISTLQEADIQVEVADSEPLKLPAFTGTWIKDHAASDSMEDAMRLIHLNGVVRTAVRLIKGVKIDLDAERFHFGVFSVISWFKVTEHYTLGEPCCNRRRDMRRGQSTGIARITPWGTLRLEYEWGNPHAGRGVDEFKLDSEGRLHVACNIYVGDESAAYTLVYNRKQ